MDYHNLVEIQEIGFNFMTVSAAAIVVFTIGEAWGLLKQGIAIWRKRSGLAVSNILFIYLMFMFAALVVYGLSLNAAVVVGNGLLSALCWPILIGLWKFKGFSLWDKIIFATCFFIIIGLIILPHKKIIFFLFMLGSVLALLLQGWEMWKQKSNGVVEIKTVLVYFISTLFWIIYSLVIKDWPLMVVTSLSLVALTFIILLWKHFHYKEV